MTLLRFARGDFLERTRNTGFVMTLVIILMAASLGLPTNSATYATVDLDGWRGLYDSAWVGVSVSLLTSLFLSLIGFYLVKNSLERDRRSGVGLVLGATPLSRFGYLMGKTLSNAALLGVLVLAVMVMAVVMQWVRGESRVVVPLDLAAPFLLVTLPFLFLVAAFAVLFEAIPLLRGSVGNVAWFFLWASLLVGPGMDSAEPGFGKTDPGNDPMGASFLIGEMMKGAREAVPGLNPKNISVGVNIDSGRTLQTFDWGGIDWSAERVFMRLAWLLAVPVIVGVAVPFFDRFSGDGGVRLARQGDRRREGPGVANGALAAATPVVDFSSGAVSSGAVSAGPFAGGAFSAGALTAIGARGESPDLVRLVAAEIRLLVKGVRRTWWLVALGLSVAAALAPGTGGAVVAAIAWIWPLAIWSAMGCREKMFGTAALLDSAPRPVTRRLLAQWMAGVLVSAVLTLGPALGAIRALGGVGLGGWLVGVLFVPALALASGAASGSRRLFEATYIVLWYVGPMNRVPSLDYTGAAPGAFAAGAVTRYAVATILLLGAAVALRVRRLRES
jgi:ABC-type multidrug transport system permease subunit